MKRFLRFSYDLQRSKIGRHMKGIERDVEAEFYSLDQHVSSSGKQSQD